MRMALTVLVTLFLAQTAAGVRFRVQLVNQGESETAALADLNNDGRLDIISSESWYEAPAWTRRPLRAIPFTSGYVDNFSDLPLDVDQDGFVDVVQIGYFARRLAWIRNPGTSGGPWTDHTIDAVGPTEFAFLVDLDNDGQRRELLPQFTSAAKTGLQWYEVRNGTWIKHEVARQSFGHGIGAGDVNGDRRADILTPQGWLEAPADPRAPGDWTFHQTDWSQPRIPIGAPPAAPGQPAGATPAPIRVEYGFMHVLDINADGRNDILTTMAHSFGVLWFEQTADGTWTQHLIDNTWSRAHASVLTDVNGDGRLDFVTGARFMGRNAQETEPLAIYWYEFTKGPASAGRQGGAAASSPVRWTRHTISAGGQAGAGLQIAAADLDKDGDMDVVSGGKSGLFVAENLGGGR